ncbi:MAG: WhiB family transcriptional regulator [Candidatus Saccharimonadales bacterium]
MTTFGWAQDALCASGAPAYDAEVGEVTARQAQDLCRGCPVKAACRGSAFLEEYNLPLEERQGIRGGLTPEARTREDTLAAWSARGGCRLHGATAGRFDGAKARCRTCDKQTRQRTCRECGGLLTNLPRHMARVHGTPAKV